MYIYVHIHIYILYTCHRYMGRLIRVCLKIGHTLELSLIGSMIIISRFLGETKNILLDTLRACCFIDIPVGFPVLVGEIWPYPSFSRDCPKQPKTVKIIQNLRSKGSKVLQRKRQVENKP